MRDQSTFDYLEKSLGSVFGIFLGILLGVFMPSIEIFVLIAGAAIFAFALLLLKSGWTRSGDFLFGSSLAMESVLVANRIGPLWAGGFALLALISAIVLIIYNLIDDNQAE